MLPEADNQNAVGDVRFSNKRDRVAWTIRDGPEVSLGISGQIELMAAVRKYALAFPAANMND